MSNELSSSPIPGVLAGWEGMSQAERDAAYNNTASVKDVAILHAARAAASATMRARPGALLDIAYGTGLRNCVDMFPAADSGAPCLVFIHGGYWQMNSKESFACLGEGVAAHGWSVALPGYTLAPDATLSEIVAEIATALSFLAERGPGFGIAGPLIVAGWSAGGHLAALALEHPHVVAGLSISGLHELAPLRDTYLNERLRLSSHEIEQLSPLRRRAVAKPLVIAYGTAELPALICSSRAFFDYREAACVPGALIPVDDRNHFTILPELRSPDGVLTSALLRLGG